MVLASAGELGWTSGRAGAELRLQPGLLAGPRERSSRGGTENEAARRPAGPYSTVTVLAKLRGWSMWQPRMSAMW